jgi:hypothetical protein
VWCPSYRGVRVKNNCSFIHVHSHTRKKNTACLPKCKLYIKGLTLGEAQEEVHKAVEADPVLYSLKDILNNEVVQVEGMVCVGVPISST